MAGGLRRKELRKALVGFLSKESIGGNAGPNRACANAIIDEEGNILGFSNYPEDYKGHREAHIIFNYKEMFEKLQKEYQKPKLVRTILRSVEKIKKPYRLPYFEKIIYEGPNREKVIENIKERLEEAGYKKIKTEKNKEYKEHI